jgi:nucleoside-diphosphate-sugar epimerase
MTMGIAITGSTGFLGGQVAGFLSKRGIEVHHINRSSSKTHRIFGANASFIDSTLSANDFSTKFRDCNIQVVVHAATLFTRSTETSVVAEVVDANFSFPIRVFEAARETGARFINFNSFWQNAQSERGLGPYAATKEAFKKYIDIATPLDMKVHNVYIPETFGSNDPRDKIVANLVKSKIFGYPYEVKNPDIRVSLTYSPFLGAFISDLAINDSSPAGPLAFVNFEDVSLGDLRDLIADYKFEEEGDNSKGDPIWKPEVKAFPTYVTGLPNLGDQVAYTLRDLVWKTLRTTNAFRSNSDKRSGNS